MLVIFCIDWNVSKKIFSRVIEKLRAEKGSSRLRHLDLFNNFLLCNGRFAQEEAKSGIKYLLKGIDEASDEISELIVSMLIYCFIIPVNINLMKVWVSEPTVELVDKGRLYQLDSNTGYEINESVRLIIKEIVTKISEEKDM